MAQKLSQSFLGCGQGLPEGRANGQEFLLSAWVSQLSTLLTGQRGWWRGLAHRPGPEEESTSCFLSPVHVCAVDSGAERTEWGLARWARTNLPPVGKCTWCDGALSAGMGNLRRGHLPGKQGARQAPIFAPTVGTGYFPGIMEHIGYSDLEGSGGGKETGHETETHSPPSRHPSSQNSWLYQPWMPGTCCLEIKLFFTSTCLAKWNGGRQGSCFVPFCLPIIFQQISGYEIYTQ